MISEVMNSSIPRTGLLMPPCESCGIEASGLCSLGTAWVSVVRAIVVARSVLGRPAVPDVEQWPLGTDLREPVEVVGRRRRAGRPFQGIGLPGVVASRSATAQRDEDVPQQQD